MMTLWILFGLMALVAVAFAVAPLLRQKAIPTVLALSIVVFVVGFSSIMYYKQGSPDLPSGGSGDLPGMDDAVAALSERLEQDPENVDGWMMLGRSYMSLGDFSRAIDAFGKAIDLEPQNAQAMVSLGEARLASTNSAVEGEISALFENALAIDPNNPQALFYGGIGAFNRDDQALAADRWERLLSLNPPAEIQGILQQRIAEWRGEAPPALPPQHPPIEETAPAEAAETPALEEVPEPAGPGPGAVVRINVAVSQDAAASLPAEAIVFVIARDTVVPVPPIAVARRRLSELPVAIDLGDRESMVPGRELSTFAEFEVIVRVSLSGQPSQQPGDWFGTATANPADKNVIDLVIDQQVP